MKAYICVDLDLAFQYKEVLLFTFVYVPVICVLSILISPMSYELFLFLHVLGMI